MALPIVIKDGVGGGYEARVTSNNALKVSNTPAVVADFTTAQLTAKKALVEAFTNPAGRTLMNVVGTLANPQRFSIYSSAFTFPGGTQIYKCQFIKTIKIVMVGSNINPAQGTNMRRFGPVASPGLTNGIKLQVIQQGVVTDIFLQPAKILSDLFQYTTSYMSFTDTVASGTDDLILTIELPEPIVIPASSLDRIDLVIQDDLHDFVDIHAQVIGWFEWVQNADPTNTQAV